MKKKYLFFILLGLFLFIPHNTYAKTYNIRDWTVANNTIPFNSYYYDNFKYITFTQTSNHVNFDFWTNLGEPNNYDYVQFNMSIYLSSFANNIDYDYTLYETFNWATNNNGSTTYTTGDLQVPSEHFNAYTTISSNTGTENMCSMYLISTGAYSYNYQVKCPTAGLDKIDDFHFSYKGTPNGTMYVTYMFSGKFGFIEKDSSVATAIDRNTEEVRKQTEETKKTNQALNDDSTEQASTTADTFVNNFNANSHGLSGLITAPLRLIQSFTTQTCQPLQFTLPFVHNQVSLPCMRGIYENYFGIFFTLYQLITTGLIAYSVGIRMFAIIRGLQDPQNDKIEVLNL